MDQIIWIGHASMIVGPYDTVIQLYSWMSTDFHYIVVMVRYTCSRKECFVYSFIEWDCFGGEGSVVVWAATFSGYHSPHVNWWQCKCPTFPCISHHSSFPEFKALIQGLKLSHKQILKLYQFYVPTMHWGHKFKRWSYLILCVIIDLDPNSN